MAVKSRFTSETGVPLGVVTNTVRHEDSIHSQRRPTWEWTRLETATCGQHVLGHVCWGRRGTGGRGDWALQRGHAKCQSSRAGSHISQRYAVRADGDVMCNLKANAEADGVVASRDSPRPLRHPGLCSVRESSTGTRYRIGSSPSWPSPAHPHVFHIQSCLPPVCQTCHREAPRRNNTGHIGI